jgi:lipopolysaccharide transport system permease protein
MFPPFAPQSNSHQAVYHSSPVRRTKFEVLPGCDVFHSLTKARQMAFTRFCITSSPEMRISFPFRDLWLHRDLLWQFTLRNIEVRHKGSYLGLIWSVLSPLLLLALYVYIFGYIFGGNFGEGPNETRLDYALGLFTGLAILQMVSEVIAISPMIFVSQPNFVKKVVFPLEILPAASVGSSVFHFLISIVLVALGVATLGPGLSWSALWLPIIILPIILMALGLSWFISSVGVFFRDIGQVTPVLIPVLMYSSAVFFPAKVITGFAWSILRFNPLLHATGLARDALLWHRTLNPRELGYLYASGIGICWLGHLAFRKMKPAFADVL